LTICAHLRDSLAMKALIVKAANITSE
jgi:hypothetical protein